MALDAGTLQAKLSIDSSDIDALKGKASGLAGFMNNVLGSSALGGVTAGLLGVGAAAVYGISTIGGYQDALAKLQSMAMVSADQAKAIGTAFLSTAGTVTFSAEEMLQAFSPVAGQLSNMYGGALNAAQSLTFMQTAMALAEATGTDLKGSVATLTNIMQDFGLSLDKATHASDVLYNTSRMTNIPITTLDTTFGRLHQKLNEVTPTLDDLSTLFVDFADAGVRGGRAIMAVVSGMTTLLGGSKPVTAEIEKLGLTVFDANGKFIGMSTLLPELTAKLDVLNPKQRLLAENILFGKGAAETWNLVLTDTATQKLPSVTKAVEQAGTAMAAAKTNTDTLGGAFAKLGAYIKDETVLGFQQLMNLKWSDFRDHMGLLSSVIQNLTKGWQSLTTSIYNGISAWVAFFSLSPSKDAAAGAAAARSKFIAEHPGMPEPPPIPKWGGGPLLSDQLVQLHAGEYVGNPKQYNNAGSMAAMQEAMGGGGGHTFNVSVTQTNPSPSDISNALAWRMAHM